MISLPDLRWLGTLVRSLTEREREVLDWLAWGKRDVEIARIMGLAPATVSKHVERLLAKLGVGNRTAAARMAFVAGDPGASAA